MDPLTSLFTGGGGGITLSPSLDTKSGVSQSNLTFGNSAPGGDSIKNLLITGTFVLAGIWLWGKAK
ncbi:MAG: hypothetical protein COA96_14165 [SAR86 cluster bacterium]|uniref:Uncharacterized protein n=1 Tax=SAR86 cluster bacterium TaxID=2030880 RepID=A0A2A5ATS1_9GAMM|nr:MAG: hypothetical protein COA96_14165 [SAR86 cluster bacterium]